MSKKNIVYILLIIMFTGIIIAISFFISDNDEEEKEEIKIPIIGMNTLKREMERTNIQLEYMVEEVGNMSEKEIEEIKLMCRDPYCYKCLYENWDDELKEYTKGLCEESGIPYEYVLGVIWLESRFDGSARSSYGGYSNYGLMQINGINYEYLRDKIGLENVEDLMDEKMNIKAGISLLKEHLDYTGDYDDMILRYQVGGES